MIKEENLTKNNSIDNIDEENLKKYFSHCFDKCGNFDFNKFKKEISKTAIDFSKESYGMDWLGKSYARLLASDPATTLLKEDKIWNNKEENKNSENVLIKGDNLEVLKHLSHAYHEQIKMIYIDPPYNTGSDGFVYNDDRNFSISEFSKLAGVDEVKSKRILDFVDSKSNSHSAWLTFMYPRLYIALQLLKDDGVIFISIDDNEVAQLKILMDEVFGEENFITQFIWQKKTGASDAIGVATITEYILTYSKNKTLSESTFTKNFESFDSGRYSNSDKHEERRGKHYSDNLDRGGLNYSDSMNFGIKCPDGTLTFPNGRNNFVNDGWIWKWSKSKVSWGIENNFIEFKKSTKKESGWSINYKNYLYVDNEDNIIKRSAAHKNLLLNLLNTQGTKNLKDLFDDRIIFKNSKPSNLISKFISYTKFKNKDIILDFFGGSGTTGDAVMKMNAEDGGKRKYIIVQLPEEIDKKKNKVVYDFIKNQLGINVPTIFDISKERLVRAAKKIREDNVDKKTSSIKEKCDLCKKETTVKKPEIESRDLSGTDLGFRIFETCPIWEDYNFEAEKLDKQVQLFDESKLSNADIAMLLTTWKTKDNIVLTQDLKEVDLGGYTGHYFAGKLYLMDKNFKTNNLNTLLEKIDSDENFQPNNIIVFGYHFESKNLREIADNISSYANKKSLDIDFIIRY